LDAVVLEALSAHDPVVARLAQVWLRFRLSAHHADLVGSGSPSRTIDGDESHTGQRSPSESNTSRSA
jgi:hypothetical protein